MSQRIIKSIGMLILFLIIFHCLSYYYYSFDYPDDNPLLSNKLDIMINRL